MFVENWMEKSEENCAANRAKNNTFDEGNFIVREFFCVLAEFFLIHSTGSRSSSYGVDAKVALNLSKCPTHGLARVSHLFVSSFHNNSHCRSMLSGATMRWQWWRRREKTFVKVEISVNIWNDFWTEPKSRRSEEVRKKGKLKFKDFREIYYDVFGSSSSLLWRTMGGENLENGKFTQHY